MSENTRVWLASSIQTFVATFLSAGGSSLINGDIAWTGAFWAGIILVAVRAGIKAVFEKSTIPALGGKR